MRSQKITPQQTRWDVYLSSFWFNTLHNTGKANPADLPSRIPDYELGKEAHPLIMFLKPVLLKGGGLSIGALTSLVSTLDIEFSFPTAGSRDSLMKVYALYEFLSQYSVSPMYTFKGGLWWFWDHLYVPITLKPQLLADFHESPAIGNAGVACMLASLTCTYCLPGLPSNVLQFVVSCDLCQHIKINTKAAMGSLQPLTIPDRPWSVIGIDFIVKLPLFNGFDSIFVIEDHFTKGDHFIPCCESMNLSLSAPWLSG